jgi:hypothetical protein
MTGHRQESGDPGREVLVPVHEDVEKLIYACNERRGDEPDIQDQIGLIGGILRARRQPRLVQWSFDE